MLLIFRKTALFNIKLQFLMKSLTLIIFWLKNRIYLECDYSEEEGWDFPKEGFPSPPCPAKRSLQIHICPSQFQGDILHKGEAMDTSLPNPPNPVQPNEKKVKNGKFHTKKPLYLTCPWTMTPLQPPIEFGAATFGSASKKMRYIQIYEIQNFWNFYYFFITIECEIGFGNA